MKIKKKSYERLGVNHEFWFLSSVNIRVYDRLKESGFFEVQICENKTGKLLGYGWDTEKSSYAFEMAMEEFKRKKSST